MKTKQEQIEAMHKVFCNACKDKFQKGHICPWQDRTKRCYNCENFCKIFYNAGYGDVSEYKAEIERLKEKNNKLNKEKWSLEEELKKKELEITYARNNGYEKGYDECEEYTKGEIKQAKINILRELKENAVEIYSKEFGQMEFVGVDAIDELIKEVQNGEDKG